MLSKIGSQEYIVIMPGDGVKHNSVEGHALEQRDTQPSRTPTADLACRAIKCTGKILLGVFTVPAMAVFITLTAFVSSIALYCHATVAAYKKNICSGIILTLATMPLLAVTFITLFTVVGFIAGICNGAVIAYKCSTEPLTNVWNKTKDTLSGKIIADIEKENREEKEKKAILIQLQQMDLSE